MISRVVSAVLWILLGVSPCWAEFSTLETNTSQFQELTKLGKQLRDALQKRDQAELAKLWIPEYQKAIVSSLKDTKSFSFKLLLDNASQVQKIV